MGENFPKIKADSRENKFEQGLLRNHYNKNRAYRADSHILNENYANDRSHVNHVLPPVGDQVPIVGGVLNQICQFVQANTTIGLKPVWLACWFNLVIKAQVEPI